MRARRKGKKLGRPTAHRLSMLNNLVTSLFEHGRIKTTIDRAKEAGKLANKVLTMAKNGTLHDRRNASKVITKASVLKNLFEEIAPLFQNRKGGYTRALRLGFRKGDGAQLALLELVEKPVKKVETEVPAVEEKKEEGIKK